MNLRRKKNYSNVTLKKSNFPFWSCASSPHLLESCLPARLEGIDGVHQIPNYFRDFEVIFLNEFLNFPVLNKDDECALERSFFLVSLGRDSNSICVRSQLHFHSSFFSSFYLSEGCGEERKGKGKHSFIQFAIFAGLQLCWNPKLWQVRVKAELGPPSRKSTDYLTTMKVNQDHREQELRRRHLTIPHRLSPTFLSLR